jgi:16S rRNA (guanine527-N7)-methyltransferase
MDSQPSPRIRSLARDISADFPALDADVLGQYLGDIIEWNERVPLISRQSTLTVLDRLVRQSAELYEFARRHGELSRGAAGTAVVDIGTGAGFPGLVWKLMDPDLRVTLVERKGKKTTFLERAKIVLRLDRAEIVNGDAWEISGHERFRGRFDVATSFAVGAPADVARHADPFLRDGGCYLTMRPLGEVAVDSIAGYSLDATEDSVFGRFCLLRKLPR